MSRIGNRKLVIPENVTVTVEDNIVTVKGPKGELSTTVANGITVKVDGEQIIVKSERASLKAIHGTSNSNIKNMIEGVTEGFSKSLEILGVGYRFALQGDKTLIVSAGYSKPAEVSIPEGISAKLVSNTEITLESIDKIKLGEFAANVRKIRKPEPYKGKGIRYKDEYVRRKVGKKAA